MGTLGQIAAKQIISSTLNIAFTDGDTARRITVSNAAILSTSRIVGMISRPNSTDDSADKGYHYTINVVNITSGSFDLFISCLAWGMDDCTQNPPNETIVFNYLIL